MRQLQALLADLLVRSEATAALLIDQGGFMVASEGNWGCDQMTMAALTAGAFNANQAIAKLVHETHFHSVYQQGEQHSILINQVDQNCLLVVLFNARLSVGLVKLCAAATVPEIANLLAKSKARSPEEGFDLSLLNMANPAEIFQKNKS